MRDYSYFKHHAWAAGMLLTIVFALEAIGMMPANLSAWLALPILIYLGISLVFAYLRFKDRPPSSSEDVEFAKIKSDEKIAKKKAKAQAKAEKKKNN